MNREPNITSKHLDKYRRLFFHNPVFNLLSVELDNVFKEKSISDDTVIEKFYVDSEENKQILTHITETFKREEGSVYFLLGKKGMGKTIFLKSYLYKMRKGGKCIINDNDIIVYLDLRTKKSDNEFLNSLPQSLFPEIFFELKRNEKISPYLTDPAKIRELDISYKYMNDNTLAQRVLDEKHKGEIIEFLFRWSNKKKYGIIIILDNIDDFPVASVKTIIDKCIELKNKFAAHCIVSLRDYWSPRCELGIDDIQTCTSHIGKPDIYKIIQKRLKSVNIANTTSEIQIKYANKIIKFDTFDIIETFGLICQNLAILSRDLHEELYQLANYNTREHLVNMYNFFHSPYLFSKPNFIWVLIEKLKKVDPDFEIDDARPIKFFDFIECLMAIHYLFYDTQTSQIFNIFCHDWPYEDGFGYRNTLIYIRILQIVKNRGNVHKDYIVEHLKSVSYEKDAILDAIDKLLGNALLESHEGIRVEDVNDIMLSIKGLAYLSRLIYEYSYLLFVCDAVPMPEVYKVDLIKKFGLEEIPLERGNLALKHESVKSFIDFIEGEEKMEEEKCSPPIHREVLSNIKRGENTSRLMRYYTSQVMKKMIISAKKPKTQKIQDIRIITK
ncbi:MAG: hypothetical protein ABSE89_02410 [Sedimentisphaerales bacterium]